LRNLLDWEGETSDFDVVSEKLLLDNNYNLDDVNGTIYYDVTKGERIVFGDKLKEPYKYFYLNQSKKAGNYEGGGGVNNKIKIKGFPPISKEEALLMQEDFEQNFSSNIEKYTKHLNRVHNSKLRVMDVKEVIDFANTYAEGGEVEDWMEEALASLIEETGNDDLEITYVVDSKIKYEFVASDGDVEYRVFQSEDDAEQIAVEQVREDMEETPENFNQDFIAGYVDGRDFFTEALNEMNYSYANDIQTESDSRYENRLIAEMVENGLMDEEDAESGNADELADYYKDDYVSLLTEGQLNEGANGLQHFIDNFGEEEAMRMVIENNLIDIESASTDAVRVDGIAHFLSSYDGETLYLSNNYVAYRIN
jgi:hypothetical protein